MTEQPDAPAALPRQSAIERYEHECGLIRVQALSHDERMQDRVEGALGVASRHLDRVRNGVLPLNPAVEREINGSLQRARALLGVGES